VPSFIALPFCENGFPSLMATLLFESGHPAYMICAGAAKCTVVFEVMHAQFEWGLSCIYRVRINSWFYAIHYHAASWACDGFVIHQRWEPSNRI